MARTRQAIVAAGMELFAERGFDAVTVADIAARADIAPRTFHRYFPDKAELLFADDTALRDALLDALRQEPPGGGIVGHVRTVIDTASAPLAGHYAELVVRERLLDQVPALRARDLAKRFSMEQLTAEHLAEHLGVSLDHDVRPRWWAGVAFATFTAAYRTWLAEGGDLPTHIRAAAALLPSEVPGASGDAEAPGALEDPDAPAAPDRL